MFGEQRYLVKFNSTKYYLLLIKQKQKKIKNTKNVSEWNNVWKPRATKLHVHIFKISVNLLIPALSWNKSNIILLILHWLLWLLIHLTLLTFTILTQSPEQNSEAAAGGVLKDFANFTGKHLCWSLFFTNLQAFRSTLLLKRYSYTYVFLWNLRNSYEHLFERTIEWLLLCINHFIISWFLLFTTVHVFHSYKWLLLYYATKTIELMTREAVSFQEVFHWTKFLAFES